MADIQSNINVNINTSEALASIRTLQRQISAFYESMARSGAAASAAASNMQNNLINTINQTGKFSASIKTIASTTEAFTTSLEKNKLSMGQYFKFAGGASKTFGKFFKTEMDTIDKVARERVKTLQTQYIKLGRDASGALKSIAIRPLTLDMKDLGTQTAIAAQKQQLMNQLLKQGSTNLLNFGKNTQWAGRQLMVGFTIPLAMVGTAAAKTFMKMEEQAIKFKRVYGDSMTPGAETDAMVKQIRELATEFTKYGVAAEKTMELAATAAAAGKQGLELTAQVREANRLAVLGQVEQQEALSTTISITNAFGVAASDLAKKIDFLNAVENQTVTSIEDLTIAVPKAGPVVKQLGGDVEDLAFFLTAMKEGGINASEGANALKSGLAALINPTGKAADMLASFGINVKGIVEANKGDVKGLVVDFAKALDTLDPLSRARAIEQLFGKFQFSRLSTLFQNVIAEGTQASRVLELTGRSASDLAALSSKELGTVAASSMFKFQKAVEDLKVALAPIGEIFLKLVTPLIEFGTKVLDNFNKLDAGAKNFIVGLIGVVGGLGPVLIMTFGLLANGIANIIKGFMLVRNIFTKSGDSSRYLGDQTEYMTQQQLEAAGVAASLEQVHQRLEQRFTSEAIAVDKLTQALQRANNANLTYMGRNTGTAGAKPKKYAKGVVSVPGPKGAGDIVPAMLAPGEAVVPAEQATKYAALIQGIIADNIPGFKEGRGPRPGTAASGRKGKSGVTVQRPYGANISATGGLVSFTGIDPSDLADLSNIYIKQIKDKAGVSVAAINAEIDQWTAENIDAINLATEQVNAGVEPTTAFKNLTEKFATDMKSNNGAVAKLNDTFEQMVPELQADLREAQQYAEKYKLNIKDSADDAQKLANALPNNQVAQMSAKPGNYQSQAKNRQALTAIQGGASGIATKGQARFMTAKGQPVTSPAYMSAASQEHFSTTLQQVEQRALNKLQRIEIKSQASLNKIAKDASKSVETMVSSAIKQTQNSIVQGMNAAIQRSSPPKEAIQIGRDYGFALNGALRESIPKVKVAGAAFGIAATTSMTTISPAMSQHLKDSAGKIVRPYLDAQGRLVPIVAQKVQVLDEEAKAARRAADAIRKKNIAVQQEASQEILAAGAIQSGNAAEAAEDMQDLSRSIVPVETGLARFGSGLRNSSFVITSLAAAGTMAGGEIGEMSSKIMQFSGIIFAATTVIDLMVAAERRRTAAAIAAASADTAQAGSGFLATISNFLMMSPGKAAAAKFLPELASKALPLKGAFAAAGGGLKGFITVIKNAAINVGKFVVAGLRFVPVIGWIITAISAFIVVTNLISEAKEKERLATEGVADAMRKAKDSIPALSELLGKAKTNSLAERLAQGSDATDSKEKVSLVTSLTTGEQSEQFKEVYGELIDSMKSMSKAEIETVQNTLALQLQSTGQYAQEEIESIIKAIQIKAGKKDVVFEFKSIDITSKNFKGFKLEMERISADLQDALSSGANETRVTEAINTSSEAYVQTLTALSDALYNGVISAEEYEDKMKILTGTLLSSAKSQEITKEMMSQFADVQLKGRPAMAAFANNIELGSVRLSVMSGIASGAIPDLVALTEVVSALNTVIAFESGDTSIDESMYRKALAIKVKYEKLAAAKAAQIDAGNKGTGTETDTGGTKEKTPWETATEQLRNQTKEMSNASTAYNKLTKAGIGARDAFEAAKDPALATALATTKVGTSKWKELVDLIKEFNANAKLTKVSDTLKNLANENTLLTKFDKLSRYLQQMGLSGEDIQSVIGDPDLAEGLIYATGEGTKGLADIDKYIAQIKANKEIRISILPLADQFKERMQKVSDWFSNERNALEIKLKIDTKADTDIARKAQQQIDTINFQVDDFEAGLTRLEDGEEAINEKYDNRIEALDKVIAANDRIAEQNKEELNIFQMVAKGDIAGAAAGIAQLQQQKAKNALEAKKESLEAQRKNELESITAEVMVNGQKVMLTRNEIEANLKNLKQQIFEIEEKTLEPARRRIDILTATKDNLDASLTVLGLTEDEWVNIESNIGLAKTRTTEYLGELQKALDVARQIPGALAGTSKSGQEIVGKPDIVPETDFGANAKIPKPKPAPVPGGKPPAPVVVPQPGDPGFIGPVAPPQSSLPPGFDDYLTAIDAYVEENREYAKKPLLGQIGDKFGHETKMVELSGKISQGMESGYAWAVQRFGKDKALKEAYKLSLLGTSDFWKEEEKTGFFNSTPAHQKTFRKFEPMFISASKLAVGGKVKGPGTGTSDSIPALLSNGEYVIRANAVKALGTDTLDKMNYADKNRFANGGSVGRQEAAMAARGGAKSKSNPLADIAKAIFFAPLDMAKDFNSSIRNILTGKGQGGDFLNVASALPIGKGASLLGKGFGAVKSLIKNRPGSIESMLNRSVIATRMPHDTLLQMLRTGDTKYRTAFETGTGADFITQTGHLAGKPDPYNKRMRHAMEEYAFAIDYKKNTLEQRPTYGLMATVGPINKALNAISGGKYAKRFNELTNPMNTKLDLYGDISLISNKKVPKRSQFYAGDLRNAYYQNDAHFMYRKTQGINFPPMRGASQAEIAGNPSGFLADKVKPLNIGDSVQFAPYIEAYTRGGFDLSEISKILVSNPNILKTLPQELKKSGLDIPVKLYPGIRSKEILFKTLDFLADIEDKVRGKNTLKLNSQDMPKFADGGLVDRRDAAMAARNPNAARDKLFKKGGIQGFEAGIQGMLSDFGKLDPVKNFANFLTDKGNALAFETRKTMAFLSTPVEILGGKAKSFATIASQISKGNIPGAIGTALKSGLGIDTIESIGNAYSGVLDPSKQKATMFEQAGQTVISNKLFGAGNPESDALARVIAGSLNLAGDPLSYLGVGAAAKGIKLSASAATSAAKIGQIGNVVKNVGKAAGYTPGLLGLPNAADVQNIASLLNKGKISGGVGSTAKAEDTSWADFDPFDDSSVVPTTVPTISLGTSSPLDNVFTSEPVRKVVDTDANTSNYEELAMSKVRNLFHPLKNPEGLSYTYKPIDLMFGDPGHIIEAKTPTGESVGKLEWKADTGEIDMVFVDRDFQRKGVATDMWHMANIEALKNPNILHPLHSPELSATGRAWRDSVGGGMLEDTINAKFKFNRENLVNPREEYLKTISNNANIAEKLKTPGKIMDMFGMKGNLSASGLTPDELYTIEEYIARPGRLHFSTFKNVRKTVDDIISKNNLTIPKGSNLVRVTGNRDAAQLAEMKAGDRFTLDQFWSVTSGEDTDFLEGMATASKDTGGRYSLIEMINGKPVAKKFPLIKFNVRSDVPGIWNMNSLLEEPASDVIDGLLARGQSMEIESITTGIDGQKIYNINLGSIAENSSIPELGLNEFSTKKWYEQMRNDPSLDPKYAKDWTEQGFIKEMNKIRMDEMSPIYRAKGGIVAPKYFANGGMVMPKYFAKGGDVVPAMLTPGEFVMTKHAVDNYGVDNLRAINSGAAPGNSVYNGYNINVNVRSNSNPDQIANAVMTQIRQVNAQQVRGSKF
jgi:TP901 family phage tail tape measure protein